MKKERKTEAISVRLEPEMKRRLGNAARRLDLSENDIARHAIRAVIQAVEKDHFEIKLPLKLGIAVPAFPANADKKKIG